MFLKKYKEQLKYILYSLLIFLPANLFRDFTPRNELKYISIAKEVLREHLFFILKNHGEIYADKPPFYFWLINISRYIFKTYSLPAILIFSITPAILILFIMNRWTKTILDKNEREIGALMLISTVMFLGSAIVVRMDMLMTLFILLSLFYFYRTYEKINRNSNEIYLMYLFIFLAVFTKGPSGIVIPIISITIFSLLEKRKELIKDIKLIHGTIIILALTALWFLAVYIEGGSDYLYNLTFKQTVGRSVNSFAHKRAFYYYLETMWGNFAPWTFFYILGIVHGIKNYKKSKIIEKFFLIIVLSTFVFFSFISGKLAIYLLPIYCFIPYISLSAFKKLKNKKLFFGISLLPFVIVLSLITPFIGVLAKKYVTLEKYYILFFIFVSLTYISSIIDYKKEDYLNFTKKIFLGLALSFFILSFKIDDINQSIGLKYLSQRVKNRVSPEDNLAIYKSNELMNIDAFFNRDFIFINNKEELHSSLNKSSKDYILMRKKDYKKYLKSYKDLEDMKIIFEENIYILLH